MVKNKNGHQRKRKNDFLSSFASNKMISQVCEDINYCIVIPFANEYDYKRAINEIKNTRMEIQGSRKKWWADGMIIDKEDYTRLLKKSKSIEIINELEEDYELEED